MEEEHKRPSWDEYFLDIMDKVGARGTCDRGRSGCIVVREHQILVTGYVGSPAGIRHCDEIGHEMKKMINDDGTTSEHCVRTTHAEQNAICQAAKIGVSLKDATIYCKMVPCYTCAKMIINCGIKRVVAAYDYHASKETKRIFSEAGVALDIKNQEVLQYKRQ